VDTQTDKWDYCQIKSRIRHKGEDTTISDSKMVWLYFMATVSGHYQNYIAGESSEIPLPANVIGIAFSPQKQNASHRAIHKNLLVQLQEDGWELLPDSNGPWWERRLRRPAHPPKSPLSWFKRIWG
jgi:hypothetical protein